MASKTQDTLVINGSSSGAITLAASSGTYTLTLPTTAGTNLYFLQTNGSGVTTWAAGASASPMTLLKANSGTSTTTSANDLDTVAITGLTGLDQIMIQFVVSGLTANGGTVTINNSTDTVVLADPFATSISTGQTWGGQVVLQQEQQSSTVVFSSCQGSSSLGANTGANTSQGPASTTANVYRSNAVTTAWTASWTLSLRSGGVTSTGTVRWSWKVFKIAGQ